MSHAATPQRMTVEEFMAIPEDDTNDRYSLVEGELVVDSPTFAHEQAVLAVASEIRTWIRAAPGRGTVSLQVDTVAGPTSILIPDVQWWTSGRELPDPHTRPYPLGELVVEVRSPSTWSVDIGRKRQLYEREGVRELWLVDPFSQTVLIFARSRAEAEEFDVARDLAPSDELTSTMLPGFRLPVAELFA